MNNEKLFIEIENIKQKLSNNFSNLKTISSSYKKEKDNNLNYKKNTISNITDVKSAVLIPLVFSSDRKSLNIIFTLRSKNLNNHAGQVSFPGGKFDKDDLDFNTCALRETREELGFKFSDISLIGELDLCKTGSGYIIKPVVGLVLSKKNLLINKEEVEKIFEVPLNYFLDTKNHTKSLYKNSSNGEKYVYYDMYWKKNRIWGATARILVNFQETLKGKK